MEYLPLVLIACAVGTAGAFAVAGRRMRALEKSLAQKTGDLDRTSKLLIEKNIELLDRAVRLQKLLEAKSDFISIASHQLRTPMTEIKWGIELVQEGIVPGFTPEQIKHLTRLHESSTKMIRLVNDLLVMVHAEAGYGEYKIASCDINALTEKVVGRYEAAAREQKKKIILRLDKTGRPIAVDSDMIEIVLANLVENALWYTREEGTIDVATSFDPKGVTLAISDTGVGIPVEMRDVVFQKFKRSPAAVVMNTNGSGLGLYIVRNIVEQHGGAITFDSTEGKGTTFQVRIPG